MIRRQQLLRSHQLQARNKLTNQERYAMAKSFAETGSEKLSGHHVIKIILADGNLFGYFQGHSAAQGGFN